MTLFSNILHFLRRERLWVLLFIFLVSIYTFVSSRPERKKEKEPSTYLADELRQAETRLKEKIEKTGGVKNFLEKRPKLLMLFTLFSAVIVTIFISGLVIDFAWIFRPSWKEKIQSGLPPPQATSWGIGVVFKTILLFVLASLGLSVLLAFLKSALFKGVSSNFFILLHTTLSDLICIAIGVGFIRHGGGGWKDLGFRGVRWIKDFFIGLAGYAAIVPLFFIVLFLLVVLVQFFQYEPPPHPLVEVFLEEERSLWLTGYSLFLACVMGPVLEEIFFRGFCYPAFKKKWGMKWALVLSAAFFSLIHQNAFAFLPVFILGFALGYLYEKRGTLVPSIVLHVIHNSIFITYFFLAKEVLMKS